MSGGHSRQRRKARRATDRAVLEQKAKADRTKGCIDCGRGELSPAAEKLLPVAIGDLSTRLVLVPCDDVLAHTPPAGKHLGRCGGWVYRHENQSICVAVKASGRALVVPTQAAN